MATIKLAFGINPGLRRGATAAVWGAACRAGMRAAIEEWHASLLKRHFDESAPARYPGAYTERTFLYTQRKVREKHHQRPMEFSGDMKREILGKRPHISELRSNTSVKLKARLMVHARAMNRWSGRYVKSTGQVHDFRMELAAFSSGDIELLRKIAERVVAEHIAAAYEQMGVLANESGLGVIRKGIMRELRRRAS